MSQKKPSSQKKVALLGIKLLLILGLWLGGTYVFEVLNNLRAIPHAVATNVQADGSINVWWPTNNVKVSGLQPFKAMVPDKNVSDYTMYWSVDGGQPNAMGDSSTDYPHKEASVDLTTWTWHGAGPYHVTFRALDTSGNTLAETSVDIFRPDGDQGVTTQNATQPSNPVVASVVSALTQSSGVNQASANTAPTAPAFLSVWAPATNTHVTGLTAFKATVDGIGNDYTMVWQVDNGVRNEMFSSGTGGAHKEADVDVSTWRWRGNGPYKVTFTAEKDGKQIATSDVTIYTNDTGSSNMQPAAQPAVQPIQNQTVQITDVIPATLMKNTNQSSSGNPLSGMKFFVNPNSNAKQTADSWRASRPQDAAAMDKIANSPEAIWLGGWNSNVQSDVANKISAAKAQGAVPVFIAYNVPGRDCGSFSAGGASDANSYNAWIAQIAAGIGGSKAIVVLEPDGLALTDCLSAQQKTDRYSMISNAVSTLKNAGAIVYLDAGHPNWISADDMASRLQSAGISKADGFALNTSNFYATGDNITYGTQLSAKVGGKHFVVDTARNGQGATPDNQWCNPSGRGLGNQSTSNTGNSLVDAFLWLKNPGESDGNCNGGPSAGVWWPEYALGLAQRAAF